MCLLGYLIKGFHVTRSVSDNRAKSVEMMKMHVVAAACNAPTTSQPIDVPSRAAHTSTDGKGGCC